jgi:hypothetical protein
MSDTAFLKIIFESYSSTEGSVHMTTNAIYNGHTVNTQYPHVMKSAIVKAIVGSYDDIRLFTFVYGSNLFRIV